MFVTLNPSVTALLRGKVRRVCERSQKGAGVLWMPKVHVAEALREPEPAIIEIGAQWEDPLPYFRGARRNSAWELDSVE